MAIAVAPVYINQTHRYVSVICPHDLANVSQRTGISVDDLVRFQEQPESLAPEKCVLLWFRLFPGKTFVQAQAQVTKMGI